MLWGAGAQVEDEEVETVTCAYCERVMFDMDLTGDTCQVCQVCERHCCNLCNGPQIRMSDKYRKRTVCEECASPSGSEDEGEGNEEEEEAEDEGAGSEEEEAEDEGEGSEEEAEAEDEGEDSEEEAEDEGEGSEEESEDKDDGRGDDDHTAADDSNGRFADALVALVQRARPGTIRRRGRGHDLRPRAVD